MGLSQGAKERRRRDFGAVRAAASEEGRTLRGSRTDAACLLRARPTLCTDLSASPDHRQQTARLTWF